MPLAPVLPPPLRDGDCLTADEFLRRWEAMPDVKHAELIDGVVYMPSPVSYDHSNYAKAFFACLLDYERGTPGCEAMFETTWRMGEHQVPQPDCFLRIRPDHGGQSSTERGYCTGAPELIVEIAYSSRNRDLGVKLRLYEQMQVREYLVLLIGEGKLVCNEWTTAGYQRREPDADGIFRSQSFPGLWLHADALLRVDQPRVRQVLEQGLASPQHAEFVARINPAS